MVDLNFDPDVAELTRALRRVVGEAHRLTNDIGAAVSDLSSFTRDRLPVGEYRERRDSSPAPYDGVERRRGWA